MKVERVCVGACEKPTEFFYETFEYKFKMILS